ncbi:MAG TPA: SDR family oxidoreductase [Gemmatimonadaceae bacterium]|jgi:dehydrogenase/reductase SDR family protein 13|nr:SDR family oxidoreductase [Gemmatimonadaceae bacterium]
MTSYLVTGSNTGIGRATAEALAAKGSRVILAARSQEKTMPVLQEIRARFPNAEVEFLSIDLADLASVKAAATTVMSSGRPLDVLINNAGLAGSTGRTKDGFQLTFGTNHLGPFAFTEMLLPLLTATPQGRIVNVASEAHRGAKGINWDALREFDKGLIGAYSVSKLANVLYAKELARRLVATRVTTSSLHPGVVASDIWRKLPAPVRVIAKLFMISNEKGAQTSVYCATAPELASVSGRYYEKSAEKEPSAVAKDEALARELYDWSDSAVSSVLGQGWREVARS